MLYNRSRVRGTEHEAAGIERPSAAGVTSYLQYYIPVLAYALDSNLQ